MHWLRHTISVLKPVPVRIRIRIRVPISVSIPVRVPISVSIRISDPSAYIASGAGFCPGRQRRVDGSV